jgi:serine/threonine-protein kinase
MRGKDQDDGPKKCLGGRFDLLDRVGVGGGAEVVRARDRQLHRLVAVKLLRSRDADLRCRFAHESMVLAGMDHPAIVRVLAHDSDGDEPYTVLELIEGPDLGEHLAGSGPLPWRQVLEIGIQIADALDAAHRQGLVHRDVKPANIMFADADDRLHVKLIDFGIVRVSEVYRLPTGAVRPRPTGMGKALGTPGYLPLEAGLVEPNPSFDVFGLGATLYQLLTGTLHEEPFQSLREAHPGCDAPDDLGLVLTAALALEPEDRMQSAAELGRALEAVLAAHPERGTPSTRIDGRYELIGLAGTGAKADAYLAVHRGAGHDVVLKFLRSKDPDDVLRFTREAMLLQTFDHSALPRFYDHAPEASPPYIAMAHAPGRPASRLCAPPRLRPAEVAAVGVKLAQVLAVVHARGVLHRDINANNVLIDHCGAVMLLDFGAAELDEGFYNVPAGERRYLTPPEARVVIPHGGIGTLAWSAPEVREGRGWTDKSDVYSMGHLLFRLLTGKVPVKGADPPTSPQVYASACPEDLAAAVMSALQVDPRHRPSAAQLAQTLREALESEEEALARAVVVALPAGRPALRLVPAGLQVRAGWTEHPLPEATSDPNPQVLPDPPSLPTAVDAVTGRAPSPAYPRRPKPAVLALAAAAVTVLAVSGWWMRVAERPLAEPPITPTLARSGPPPAPGPISTPALDASPPKTIAPTSVASATDQLAAATSALKDCARVAQREILVELATTAGEPRFTAIDIVGDDAEGTACVRREIERIRFLPPASDGTLVKEYRP